MSDSAVGFDGINWVVTNYDSYLKARRISQDGIILDSVPRQISRSTTGSVRPEIAFDSVNYMIVWPKTSSSIPYTYLYTQIVTPSNSIPIADAGDDVTIALGSEVQLDGTRAMIWI